MNANPYSGQSNVRLVDDRRALENLLVVFSQAGDHSAALAAADLERRASALTDRKEDQ